MKLRKEEGDADEEQYEWKEHYTTPVRGKPFAQVWMPTTEKEYNELYFRDDNQRNIEHVRALLGASRKTKGISLYFTLFKSCHMLILFFLRIAKK